MFFTSSSLQNGRMRPYRYTGDMPQAVLIPMENLALWFRADSIAGLSDGDPVAQWDDMSLNANHATQGSSGARPVWKASILNGKPVVRFDGSNDMLSLTSNFTGGNNTTVFVVANTAGTASSLFIAQKIAVYGDTGSGQWGTYTSAAQDSGVTMDSTFICMTAIINTAADVELWTNGGDYTQSFSGGSYQARSGTAIGADPSGVLCHQGDIAEIIVYEDALNSTDRERVENYLMSKYAIS